MSVFGLSSSGWYFLQGWFWAFFFFRSTVRNASFVCSLQRSSLTKAPPAHPLPLHPCLSPCPLPLHPLLPPHPPLPPLSPLPSRQRRLVRSWQTSCFPGRSRQVQLSLEVSFPARIWLEMAPSKKGLGPRFMMVIHIISQVFTRRGNTTPADFITVQLPSCPDTLDRLAHLPQAISRARRERTSTCTNTFFPAHGAITI